jgi:hypothetical protein
MERPTLSFHFNIYRVSLPLRFDFYIPLVLLLYSPFKIEVAANHFTYH